MTPIEQAAAVYDREYCARSFSEDVEAHFSTGIVISTPTLFCLAREVWRGSLPELVLDPWVKFEGGDCWHVYLFAGNLVELFGHCTEPKEWVAFERNNVLRFYRFQSIRRKICTPTFQRILAAPTSGRN